MNPLRPRPPAAPGARVRLAIATTLLLVSGLGTAGAVEPVTPGQEASVESGRRIYFEGVDRDGRPLRGQVAGGEEASGATIACVSCHRRSGEGAQEGGLQIPPVTAPTLFRDGTYAVHPGAPADNEMARLAARYQSRHAYQDASLLRAIEQGVDADGRALVDPMPRYRLDDRQRADLLAYLHQFGARGWSAGATPFEFWVVLTAGADRARSSTARAVVERYARSIEAAEPWRIRVIDLGEDPDALRKALDTEGQAPLALLAGAAGDDWAPVAASCARHHLPCLFPSLAAPPDSGRQAGDGFYGLYLSGGLPLEARALAQALGRDVGKACAHPTIVVEPGWTGNLDALPATARAPAGIEAGAYRSGLQTLLVALAEAPRVAASEVPDGADCQILWTGTESTGHLFSAPPRPGQLRLLVQGLLPVEGFAVPDAWKPQTRVISSMDPEAPLRIRTHLLPWLRQVGLDPSALDLHTAADTYAACYLTQLALAMIEEQRLYGMRIGPFGREELVEALQAVAYRKRASGVTLYSPLHLGEAQHIAARNVVVLGWDRPAPAGPQVLDRLPPM